MTDRTNRPLQFDVLRDILDTLRFRGTMFFHSDLAAPWGMSLDSMDIPRFHIALSGCCFVGTENEQSLTFEEMGIVMVPNGNAHWIADQVGRQLAKSSQAEQACELGAPLFQSGEITNRLMCGLVQFEQGLSHPLLHSLPQILHFPHAQISRSAWATAQLLDSEIQRVKNNSSPIIDRLSEVLFIQLLEEYIQHGEEKMGFFAALGDSRLMQALKLIHESTETSWTLDTLGTHVGMSRTTLNRHFQHTIGVSAMTYIQDWKMTKAFSLVKGTNCSFEQVAYQVGFTSARTLSKAFKRQFGQSPTQLRRQAVTP